jgi:hypothetical protein
MIDLHEGVASLFEEAGEHATLDDLRLDNYTAKNLTFEASWIAEARLASGIQRWVCPNCGGEIELRLGYARPIHMGNRRDGACFWAPAGPGSAEPIPPPRNKAEWANLEAEAKKVCPRVTNYGEGKENTQASEGLQAQVRR